MSSTTGEHINELEERRQRRQQRNAAQPGPAKPPRSANTAPEARDLLRDLITNGSRPDEGAAGHLDAGRFQSDGGQRNGSSRDGGQTPTGGSSKRRRCRRARSARASRRPDRGRGGRTRDSPGSPYRHRRPFGRRGNPEPSATASRPSCRRSHSAPGRVQAAGRLGGRGCHRPNRRRRPCAVVGLRGRAPDGHDPKRANLGNGGRSRVRRCG